jgi:endonuclease/exonuclease/phosphatase family metal-dependent hydrolase
MLTKITLALLCALSLLVALRFDAARGRSSLAAHQTPGTRLRLMTWNIGYAELEDDTRAHDQDLPAIAATILKYDPDAVALQELRGEDQLHALLKCLRGRYHGAASQPAGTDRVDAVLVKDVSARFEQVPAGMKYALGATFVARNESNAGASGREVVLMSAHADAFSAARRRDYTERVVDWARTRGAIVFVAGDFNFELDARDQSHFYTDNLKHDSESYSYLLKYFRDLGRDAGVTSINDRRIDYVFATPDAARVERAEVLRDAPVGHMDHCPLLVEVNL